MKKTMHRLKKHYNCTLNRKREAGETSESRQEKREKVKTVLQK